MKKTRVKMNKPLYLGLSILDISKILMQKFGTIIFYQSMETRQNYAIQIPTALRFTLKLKIFLKTFLMMLKNDLTRLTLIKKIKYLFQ